ncbi:hypothetical protein QBC34DRAFT_195176 [Podospora aff. communis PSN243]|uniref:Uncharacterized protein n=1 Tax=Podospora aff. communis PSN243 TaxID=3040156 RepID=A0AAV9G7R5_9PEZI|nr:hypothetical protein QBC34DRAFT_195176 [Podospora aff. communis PSN243]
MMDTGEQSVFRAASHHHAPSRRRSSVRIRHMRDAYNTTNFGGNRAVHHVPRGVFSPSTPIVARPPRLRRRTLARIDPEEQPRSGEDGGHLDPLQVVPEAQWRPSIALGSPLWLEGEDLNRIQIADRKIAQRQLWLEHYNGASDFPALLEEAIQERNQLDPAAEENTKPTSSLASTHSEAIANRVALLQTLLGSSQFQPERDNITAAVTGYTTGEIPCSTSYTLIWAGHIVDRCPSHESFTQDRAARLDKYTMLHGPGWLWYEPPLSGPSTITAKTAICLENKPAWRHQTSNMGHYEITMGFRRRKAAVSVTAPTPPPSRSRSRRRLRKQPPLKIPPPEKPPTVSDPDGPTVYWSVLLDSGATFPCLFEGDLSRLGISRYNYAAQSCRTIATADDLKIMRTYDLDVSISAPLSAATPSAAKEPATLGMQTIPVVALPGSCPDDASDPAGAPGRLSGIIPFHMAYVTSAPYAFKIWMGTDRRDVLGAGRFPGSKPRMAPLELGTPTRVVFEHMLADGSKLVFKDDEEGRGSPVVSGPAVGVIHNPDEEKERQEQDPPTRRMSQGRLTRGALV